MADEKNDQRIFTMEDRSEYFGKLEKWLQEAYAWQSVAAVFRRHVLSAQISNSSSGSPSFVARRSTNTTPLVNGGSEGRNIDPVGERTPRETGGPLQRPRVEGYEYRIPPIWKRFVAEFIDSIMLLVLKMVVTFCTLDLFASVSLEPFRFDLLQSDLRIDYKMAVEVASRVLIWEMMHRFIVCVFEAFWLQNGMNGTIGGASPGKSVMGLIVVRCRSVTPIERPDSTDMVLVSPGTDLGLPLALGRSVVKNLIMTFLFPICFALFFFRFNRTGYDLACNSIVVEDPRRTADDRHRRR